MDDMTEFKVRNIASEKLGGMDLSPPEPKQFVRDILESFLLSTVEEEKPISLSEKRRVTVQDFKGKTLVSIREYYQKDGKHFPSSKGISLSDEQWSAFRTAVPAIEEAIKTMELRLG
ncbi:hypothetical protein MKX01_018371 [Papaver californicum]|nr:hypothetical protein MKX01_018371 [Papaver californicum]